MIKLRRVKYKDHPILGNLELDFCDANGNAIDTILIAGENGTGKSTILETLFSITNKGPEFEATIEIEKGTEITTVTYFRRTDGRLLQKDNNGHDFLASINPFSKQYKCAGLFSDVEINFVSDNPKTVTSMVLDNQATSQKTSGNLAMQIKQLLIDVQAMDDTDLAHYARNNPRKRYGELVVPERMTRFTRAFNRMFDGLTYSRVENSNGSKIIVFEKDGNRIPIDSLSSGEKQIVYRGCFLLKDINVETDTIVFIDEPEISLHPAWQMKIMDYYKGIFTDEKGCQTSQIFAVTHSPFIIHNDNRRNDKVIVLSRNIEGQIVVKEKPEYYKCNSMEAVQDAFSINDFSRDQSFVYVEGRTDKKYFDRALEVFHIDAPFQFRWIGYMDDKGQEVNTGKESLNKAEHFLIAQKSQVCNFLLYDCDAKKQLKRSGNIISLSIEHFNNDRNIEAGIENALNFGDIDLTAFQKYKSSIDEYGMEKKIPEFQKMKCCEYICSLDDSCLEKVLINLKGIIEKLISLKTETEKIRRQLK